MKKFLTFVLVLAMVLSVSSFAMAAEIEVSSTDDLQTKINNATAGDTIKLTGDITLTNGVEVKKQLILDLNGHSISGDVNDDYGVIYIGTAGNLTINATGGGSITNSSNNTIGNFGTVTINGGTITGDYALYNFYYNGSTYGKATINGGTFNGVAGISIANSGKLTINDGAVVNDTLDSSADLEVNGGSFENVLIKNDAYNNGGVSAQVKGGSFGSIETGITEKAQNAGYTNTLKNFISGGEFSEKPADELLDTKAVTVGNTSDGFKVVQTVYTSEPVATVFPTFHDFGSIEQGGSFEPKTFTVINGGSTKIDVELPNIPNCMVQWADDTTGRKTLKTIADKEDYSAEFTVVPNASLAHGEYETAGKVNVYSLNGSNPLLTKDVEVEFKITAPATAPSTGGGYYFVGVRYNGGNSFSTDRSDVPVAVLIDGQPVSFTGNGSNFVVDCINPGASRITIVWNTIKVDARFTPDANAYCAQAVIPKTGGMSIWAAIAQFLGF